MTANQLATLTDLRSVADALRVQEQKLRSIGQIVLALKIGAVANTLEVKAVELVRKHTK